MFPKDMLKINYSDFYKFIISSGLILWFISNLIAISLAYIWITGIYDDLGVKLILLFYIAFSFICIYGIVWAIGKWKDNQDIIDLQLRQNAFNKKT